MKIFKIDRNCQIFIFFSLINFYNKSLIKEQKAEEQKLFQDWPFSVNSPIFWIKVLILHEHQKSIHLARPIQNGFLQHQAYFKRYDLSVKMCHVILSTFYIVSIPTVWSADVYQHEDSYGIIVFQMGALSDKIQSTYTCQYQHT